MRRAPAIGASFTYGEHGVVVVQKYDVKGCHVKVKGSEKSPKRSAPSTPAQASDKEQTPVKKKTARWRDRVSPSTSTPPQASPAAASAAAASHAPVADVDKAWIRCRRPPLTAKHVQLLQGSTLTSPVDWSPEEYYVFTSRVIREYIHLQKSPLHTNRTKVLRAAVARVMTHIRPKSRLPPFDGDKDKAVNVLQPVLGKVFV